MFEVDRFQGPLWLSPLCFDIEDDTAKFAMDGIGVVAVEAAAGTGVTDFIWTEYPLRQSHEGEVLYGQGDEQRHDDDDVHHGAKRKEKLNAVAREPDPRQEGRPAGSCQEWTPQHA